jgi:hypothetical protein
MMGAMTTTQGVVHPEVQICELQRRAATLCGRINALEGELAAVVSDLFTLKAHQGGGWRSPGHYVAWLTGSARSRSSALTAAAEAIDVFPVVMGRLASGDISLDQTAAIVRTAPAWSDEVMAQAADAMTPAQLAKTARLHQVADRAQQARPQPDDAPEPPTPPVVDEFAQFHVDELGAYRGRLRLDADHGAEFEAALRAHLEVLWNEWKAAGGVGRPPRLVDALMRMMHRAADADRAGTGATLDHRRHLVVMHVDVASGIGQVHMGPVLPAWVTQEWSCDATFQMLFTKEGRSLGVGPSRTLPHRLRLAVEQRDGGCRVPGCGSRIVHLHHIHHHAHGGVSETWNLAGLCPRHHRGVHTGELVLHGTNADDPHGLTFTTARGHRLTGPQPTITPDAAQRLADLDPAAAPTAIRPEHGRVDWANVVPMPPRTPPPPPQPPPPTHDGGSGGDSDSDHLNHDSMSA